MADSRPIQFTERLIWGGFSYVFGVQAADLDGDGRLELTAADTAGFVETVGEGRSGDPNLPKHSHLYWFKFDGREGFTRHFITQDDLARRLERHVIADIDGDGRPDVVVVDNLLGDVLWYQNPGPAGMARGELWKKRYISKGGMFGAEDITVADFDGDGRLDVACAGWRLGNCFKWFRHPGADLDREWRGGMIDGGFPVARCVAAGDIDGDGRADLFATSDASRAILWYEPLVDGAELAWRRHVIDLPKGPEEPIFGKVADVNGDGRMDVVLASGGQWNPYPYAGPGGPAAPKGYLVWYENRGKADGRIQWRRHIISHDLPAACDVTAADIDGDGRLDVVATGYTPGEVAWFENPGDGTGPWKKHLLKENWPNANQVIVADLDGDGRLDIAAIADYGSMELRWWQNRGRGVG